MSAILKPLSLLYGLVASLRNSLYDKGILASYRSTIPVLSVGNLTAGGSGKTPLTALLCSELAKRGHRPVVLSRGYKGSNRGTHLVSPTDSAALVGDEPRMLAEQGGFSVVVSADRVAGAKFIEQSGLGTIIVLDDGLQHRRLARSVNILAIDCSSRAAVDGFVQGDLLPTGRFREDRESGLKRVDAVVLNARMPKALAPSTEPIERILPPTLPTFSCVLEIASVSERRSGAPIQAESPIQPFCALGNPEGFLATLSTLGKVVLPPVCKPDHATFSPAEIAEIQRAHPGAALVCTAKDAVKIPVEVEDAIYIVRARPVVENLASMMDLVEAKISDSANQGDR